MARRLVAPLTALLAAASPAVAGTAPEPTAMPQVQLLASVQASDPLQVHVSLANPEDADTRAAIPRVLEPLGAYITMEVRDAAGEILCQTRRPKFTPKLRPDSDEAYLLLEPGRSRGVLLTWEDCSLSPESQVLHVRYRNEDYQGTPDRPVGTLTLEATLPLAR